MKLKKLFIILSLVPLYASAQDGDYCRSAAVEEKLEITAYYPTTISYIGQFWDTSHYLYNFRTRQSIWLEPNKEKDTIGFGFITTDFSPKIRGRNIMLYPSFQVRFNSHISLFSGFNAYVSDNKHVKKVFYQFQLGAYRDFSTKQILLTTYVQSIGLHVKLKKFPKMEKALNEKIFFEGFLNYYPKKNEYNLEVEAGFKINHQIAIMAGYENIQEQEHFFAGIRWEMYEHRNLKKRS